MVPHVQSKHYHITSFYIITTIAFLSLNCKLCVLKDDLSRQKHAFINEVERFIYCLFAYLDLLIGIAVILFAMM